MDLPERTLAFLAAVAPACLIAIILYALGKRLLPNGVRTLALVMGPFSALSSFLGIIVFAAVYLSQPSLPKALLLAFFGAGIPEETAKFALLVSIVLRHYEADVRRDAILAGAWLGLGFGVFENFFYVTQGHQWPTIGLVRAVTSVPFHVALGMIMGFFLSRFGLKRGWPLALIVPVILHGLFDWPLMAHDFAKASIDATSIAYGGVYLAVLITTAFLVSRPVARQLRELGREAWRNRATPPGPILLAGVAGIAGLLRIGAMIAVGFATVAGFAVDARYAALVATAILPFTFAELWRSVRT